MVDCSHKQVINGVCIHCLHVLTPPLGQGVVATSARGKTWEQAVVDGSFRRSLAEARDLNTSTARLVHPTGRTRIDGAIAFLCENFHDDGAEGESVHLLCREFERQQEQLAAPRIRPCVAALVTDPAGRLLLVRTKRGWELPGGGLEVGETWRDGILRDLREETGLDVTLDDGAPRVFDGMPVNGAQYQSLIVIARGTVDTDAAPAPQADDGVHEARWFAAGEMPLDGLSNIATAAIVREWIEASLAPRWTPPPGVHPTVLRGSPDGPLLVAHVRLDPGAEVPREVHKEQNETVTAVSGALWVMEESTDARAACTTWIGPERYASALLVACGVEHTIRNASATDPAEYLAILRRVATVSDTEPAPAQAVELTDAQKAALMVCDANGPEFSALREHFQATRAESFWSTVSELKAMGLADSASDLTSAGRAALVALNAAAPAPEEG